MTHHIMVKFKKAVVLNDIFEDIKGIFDELLTIEGIHSVSYKKNCIEKENRFDLLILIDMDKEALLAYDTSKSHIYWKEKYTKMIDKKAIFDSEE